MPWVRCPTTAAQSLRTPQPRSRVKAMRGMPCGDRKWSEVRPAQRATDSAPPSSNLSTGRSSGAIYLPPRSGICRLRARRSCPAMANTVPGTSSTASTPCQFTVLLSEPVSIDTDGAGGAPAPVMHDDLVSSSCSRCASSSIRSPARSAPDHPRGSGRRPWLSGGSARDGSRLQLLTGDSRKTSSRCCLTENRPPHHPNLRTREATAASIWGWTCR